MGGKWRVNTRGEDNYLFFIQNTKSWEIIEEYNVAMPNLVHFIWVKIRGLILSHILYPWSFYYILFPSAFTFESCCPVRVGKNGLADEHRVVRCGQYILPFGDNQNQTSLWLSWLYYFLRATLSLIDWLIRPPENPVYGSTRGGDGRSWAKNQPWGNEVGQGPPYRVAPERKIRGAPRMKKTNENTFLSDHFKNAALHRTWVPPRVRTSAAMGRDEMPAAKRMWCLSHWVFAK